MNWHILIAVVLAFLFCLVVVLVTKKLQDRADERAYAEDHDLPAIEPEFRTDCRRALEQPQDAA